MSSHPLLDVEQIDTTAELYLPAIGDVFVTFGAPNQDSGNVSYGVSVGGQRFFVKSAGDPEYASATMAHEGRCSALNNAVELSNSCPHPILTKLRHIVESAAGPVLVYDWVEGELLGHDKDAADSALARFRQLPLDSAVAAVSQIYSAHRDLAQAGWIAVDFYLGSILYNFDEQRVSVIDLDMYHAGEFVNEMGRMYGSRSLMAPEEFKKGERIGQDTNVFVMGRVGLVLLGNGELDRSSFRGRDALYDVIALACRQKRKQRFKTMSAFVDTWDAARSPVGL